MASYSRRAFLGALAAAVPAAAVLRQAHAAAVDDLAAPSASLLALAEVVLPSELGAGGRRDVVEAFQRWIAGYREHAELLHLYGTSRIEYQGPSPAMRWAAQLDALDAAARRAEGRPFRALPLPVRTAMVQRELDALHAETIPPLLEAPHVALALLAHYYESPAATDRCYRAAILREQCRPLAAQARRPLPLAPEPRA